MNDNLIELAARLQEVVTDGDAHGIKAALPTSIGARTLMEKAAEVILSLIAQKETARNDGIEAVAEYLDKIQMPVTADAARNLKTNLSGLVYDTATRTIIKTPAPVPPAKEKV